MDGPTIRCETCNSWLPLRSVVVVGEHRELFCPACRRSFPLQVCAS